MTRNDSPTAQIPYPALVTWEEARRRLEAVRSLGGKIVSTNGCFDILHPGHVSYLHYARGLGDLLIVGINSDASVRKLKGAGRPVNSATARAFVLAALRSVDLVCEFADDTPVEWLQVLRPDIHVKGGDYDVATMPETAALRAWGGHVTLAPFVPGFSTTHLIETLKD